MSSRRSGVVWPLASHAIAGCVLAIVVVITWSAALGPGVASANSLYVYDALPAHGRSEVCVYRAEALTSGNRAPPDVDGCRRDSYDSAVNLARTNALQRDRVLAPRATSLADDALTTGRSASTSWGRTVQDFQQYGDQWRRVSAHAEAATGRGYRGDTSIEEVFERAADRLVRHRIYGPNGEILHETFRPYAKFGAP